MRVHANLEKYADILSSYLKKTHKSLPPIRRICINPFLVLYPFRVLGKNTERICVYSLNTCKEYVHIHLIREKDECFSPNTDIPFRVFSYHACTFPRILHIRRSI